MGIGNLECGLGIRIGNWGLGLGNGIWDGDWDKGLRLGLVIRDSIGD